jgi:hypothetical protein
MDPRLDAQFEVRVVRALDGEVGVGPPRGDEDRDAAEHLAHQIHPQMGHLETAAAWR